MIDRIRQDIEQRLNALIAEADKLRRALTALGSGGASRPPSGEAQREATSQRRARSGTAARPRARGAAKTVGSAASARSREPGRKRQTPAGDAPEHRRTRGRSGSTRAAVLAALSDGEAMTAAAVAQATGLSRATVSTTLSRLAKAGVIAKAPRGYQLSEPSEPAGKG